MYESGKRRYLSFCAQFNLRPLPVDEAGLLSFVAFLFRASLSHQTIRGYLSAVRHLQIMNGFPDPAISSLCRLNYALQGIRREDPLRHRLPRLPITPQLLRRIFQVWSSDTVSFDRIMLWAAFCIGFFGFMRSGEFTCPSLSAFTDDMLAPGDVAVDSRSAPSYIVVRLKRSKNDPFGAGVTIHLGATGDSICPVNAMLSYLAQRPPSPGPLFIFSDGSPLSRPRLITELRQALHQAGIDDSRYSGHSFRIGAATAAAQAGLSDSTIKMLGRWKSSAFESYIRTPGQYLLNTSTTLLATDTTHSSP